MASSPEAIYQSLTRRLRKLEGQLAEAQMGARVHKLRQTEDVPEDDEDFDDLPDSEREG